MDINRGRVLRPCKREMHDAAGLLNVDQGLKRGANYLQLSFSISWPSECETKRVFQRRHAGKTIGAAVIRDHIDTDGGNARFLDYALHQPNGPAADGSHRHKKRHLHAFRIHLGGNLWGRETDQLRGIRIVPHDGVMGGGQFADFA